MASRTETELNSFRRATTAATLGVALQGVITLVAMLLFFATGLGSLLTLLLYSTGGVLIWSALWLLHQQRTQQKIEAIELEQLRRSDSTSIFVDSADALTPAQRRVIRLTNVGLPLVSVVIGAYLVLVGIWLFNRSLTPQNEFFTNPPRLAAFCAFVAFIGFIAGRYILGMARVPVWQMLRGGATYLISSVIALVVLAIAFGATHFGFPGLLRNLSTIYPVLVVVVGIEILFNQILEAYRPRRKNETARPAFDSRLLTLAASPGSIVRSLNEAVNYQFGFEITQSWFWQLLARSSFALLLLGIGVLVAMSSIIVVEPNQQVLVLRYGKLVGQPRGPGLHLKLPWPIDSIERYDVTTVRALNLGSHSDIAPLIPILWTNQHAGGQAPENLLLVAPPREMMEGGQQANAITLLQDRSASSDAPAITLAGAEVFIHYRVKNVLDYAKSSRSADMTIRNIAEEELYRLLLRYDLDDLIGPKRQDATTALTSELQAAFDASSLGVEIVWIGLAGVHPAQQVADAFHETVTAEQEKQTLIQRGIQDATRVLTESVGTQTKADDIVREISVLEDLKLKSATPEQLAVQEQKVEDLLQRAGGRAAQLISESRAYRWQRENNERGRAQRFLAELAGFNSAPTVYQERRRFEGLIQGLTNSRKLLMAGDENDMLLRFDFKDQFSAFESEFDPNNPNR